MKISQISKKLIKPLTPTPQNLKNYSISFLDNFMEQKNSFAVILFYKSKPENITHLEESLAKTLVQFYPLAGRYMKNDHMVDCSDLGVEFIEAEALDVELLDLIPKIETEQLKALLPDQYLQLDETAPVLGIKVTHFSDDGVSIAVSVRHTVFEMSSLGTFISAWSGAGPGPAASFHLPSLLPYKHHNFDIATENFSCMDGDLAIKRLVFDKASLTRLRSKLRSNLGGKTVSRVRVVCAVIAKALIRLDLHRERDFLIVQGINMRGRTVPPLPKHSCGNLVILSDEILPSSEANKIGLQELVDLIGDSALKRIGECSGMLSPNRDGRDIIINNYTNVFKQMGDPSLKSIVFSDWSKFGFYEADFGWGRPVWTSVGPMQTWAATTLLMSNKEGDGIEAWVHLDRKEMHRFEQDEEIKMCLI